MARSREQRAAWHQALGDVHRLEVMELLELSDATPGELAAKTGLASNLMSFHLDVLERAGLVARRRSQGDGRRRYVTPGPSATADVFTHRPAAAPVAARRVVFVCTHNSARSPLAAALWTARTGRTSWSAGSTPAGRVNPNAVAIAAANDLDLTDVHPKGFAEVNAVPDLVVSVCDRAGEAGMPFTAPRLHWSIPAPRSRGDFPATWDDLDGRVRRLAERARAA